MNCPVCNRTLAPTLSICLTCGAMMNDSVREELQTKVGNFTKPAAVLNKPMARPMPKPAVPAIPAVSPPKEKPIPALLPPAKLDTAQLKKQKTSPTLVGFQPKNAVIPDWRLQIQNSVRGRKATLEPAPSTAFTDQRTTNGANALKIQYAPEAEVSENTESHSDPRVANALRRIANSRRTFLSETQPDAAADNAAPVQPKNFKFNVIARTAEQAAPGELRARVNVPPKPRLVSTAAAEKKRYDTNKLPPLPDEGQSSIDMVAEPDAASFSQKSAEIFAERKLESARSTTFEEAPPADVVETDEIDDLAPFSMRFNSGVFDLLIGAFASLVLLSPLALFGGNWFSTAGAITFLATCSIVMFAYLTICLGLFGKTVGMRMFSLELVDADENDYPTFHQAAVSSAAYLLTLPLAGIGFLTVFFNDEKRAAHDLLSGTIIVMEF